MERHLHPVVASLRDGTATLHKYVDMKLHERLLDLLKSLMRGTTAKEFLKPVELPGYSQIILQPMDLGTVRDNLELDAQRKWAEKTYVTAEEFAHDVRLVFKNCFLFNQHPTHHVFRDGRQKLEKFEKDLESVYREVERSGPPIPPIARCQLLLTDLRRNPLTEWFRRKEDWSNLGAAYLNALTSKQAMDLDEIQARFDAGRYSCGGARDASEGSSTTATFDAFAADVRLVWQNALDFNGEGSFVGVIVKVLQQSFERRLKDLKEAPRPVAHESAHCLPVSSRKRRRELYDASVAISGNLAVASGVVEVIERVCPAAIVRRRGADVGVEADVNLDQVDEALVEPLLEQVLAIQGMARNGES